MIVGIALVFEAAADNSRPLVLIAVACTNLLGYIDVMEKRKPHYALRAIQQIVAERKVNAFTATALVGAAYLGLSPDKAVDVVQELTQGNFFKSMTTHSDHHIWQDVYHAPLKSGLVAYIKVTLRENGIVVIQFKEK